MPWNGSGVFTRLYSWVADAAAGLDIQSDRMDQDTDDIAQGLMHCLAVNGETVPVANLPMANYRHTGASAGVADTDYCTVGQIKNGGGGLPAGGYLLLAGGTLTGPLILAGDPTAALGGATKQYVDNNYLPLTGGALSGNLTVGGTLATANGQIGQRITSGNLTPAVPNNVIYNIGSITLPAGDWDVVGIASWSAPTIAGGWAQLSTTSLDGSGSENQDVNPRFRVGSATGSVSAAIPPTRFIGPATVYLVGILAYSGGAATQIGARISARRWA